MAARILYGCLPCFTCKNYHFYGDFRRFHHKNTSTSCINLANIHRSVSDKRVRSTHTNAGGVAAVSVDDPVISTKRSEEFQSKLSRGPSLQHFLRESQPTTERQPHEDNYVFDHPYVRNSDVSGQNRKVYFETYGCQMNFNDTDIAYSILNKHGYSRTTSVEAADVILVMTCAIRENAELKVWNKLEFLKGLKRKRQSSKSRHPLKIGILGCMAERLKHKLLVKENTVDVVAGPDSYRDLPRMLALTEGGQTAVNVILSLDETYADVMPVQLDSTSPSAFVSIMRGCDNMCSYCIVPFTRGRERSRPLDSIVDEVRRLSDNGVKEVVLLGQNVNSYRDTSVSTSPLPTRLSRGFSTIYRPKSGGSRFVDLLEKVADVNPEMRIRFTSPHPKDFPDEVLHLINERHNICNQLHLPAQSGNNRILTAMRRGYSRESYLDLVAHIRSLIPDIALSSDFISGFCGETEAEFEDTLSVLQQVKYNVAFLFAYSMRERTHAYHKMVDDVPESVKSERLQRMVNIFRAEAEKLNRQQVGRHQIVLVEGPSKRSSLHLAGRNDYNTRVIFPCSDIPDCKVSTVQRPIKRGDYIVVQINDATSQVLKGIPLYHVTLKNAHQTNLNGQ